MAEDRRIRKTKKLLKQTLISQLSDCSFEQLTVKGLCEAAEVSRITFYTHYDDKYDLADHIFIDMVEIAREDYYRLQDENNPKRDAIQNYLNLLKSILHLYYNQNAFLRYAVPDRSPYLYSAFYRHITENLEAYMGKRNRIIRPRYSPKKVTAFLANGLWSFIAEAQAEGCSKQTVYLESQELFLGILKSKTLFE